MSNDRDRTSDHLELAIRHLLDFLADKLNSKELDTADVQPVQRLIGNMSMLFEAFKSERQLAKVRAKADHWDRLRETWWTPEPDDQGDCHRLIAEVETLLQEYDEAALLPPGEKH